MTAESPFARILIPIDGSERSAHVLDVGLGLARAARDTGGAGLAGGSTAIGEPGASNVTVLHVVGLPIEIPHDVLALSPDMVLERLVESARASVRALVDSRDPSIPIRIAIGPAVPKILETADELDAGLIVIGAHGYRFAERLLGTTVSRVVDRSTRSVLVVR